MAFQLKSKESVGAALERCMRREIDKALLGLRATDRRDEAAFDARKRFKKVRAALRLVRDELGDAVYRRENLLFRDAARPLTEVRDAAVFVEALDALTGQFAVEIEPRAFDEVRRALVAERQAVIHRVLDAGGALASVAGVVAPARDRIDDWPIGHDGWPALGPGLTRVYRAGRRALARASTEPSVENLHEWRKQAKYLWHQLQLLEPAWVSHEEDFGDRLHELTRLLGEDHDLAVLRAVLTADPGAHGGHRVLKGLIGLLDRRRESLADQAFALGRSLYADGPQRFTSRIEGYWNAWIPDAGSASRGARARGASSGAP
jgi:CHAD domain-containing protein